jgi:hypothetical protein
MAWICWTCFQAEKRHLGGWATAAEVRVRCLKLPRTAIHFFSRTCRRAWWVAAHGGSPRMGGRRACGVAAHAGSPRMRGRRARPPERQIRCTRPYKG